MCTGGAAPSDHPNSKEHPLSRDSSLKMLFSLRGAKVSVGNWGKSGASRVTVSQGRFSSLGSGSITDVVLNYPNFQTNKRRFKPFGRLFPSSSRWWVRHLPETRSEKWGGDMISGEGGGSGAGLEIPAKRGEQV